MGASVNVFLPNERYTVIKQLYGVKDMDSVAFIATNHVITNLGADYMEDFHPGMKPHPGPGLKFWFDYMPHSSLQRCYVYSVPDKNDTWPK